MIQRYNNNYYIRTPVLVIDTSSKYMVEAQSLTTFLGSELWLATSG
jgi:hypothetical protein